MADQTPEPECEYGYPWSQIAREWDEPFAQRLTGWMRGQTMTLCPEHGSVVYSWDLERFMRGAQIID